MDLTRLSGVLSYDPATEIWRSERAAKVAYRDGDHATCFALEDSSFWFRHRNRCILEAVKRHPPGGFILDVGGGNGFVSRALIDAGFPAVLLEPGPEGAQNARRTRRIPDVICATLDEAGLNAGSVPAVGMFDVLEHIEDDHGVVEQLHRVLQPRGHVYLTVPSFDWLWSGADVEAMHFRRYSQATLAAVFARHFEVVYMTALFGRMMPALLLGRTVPYALGLQRARTASRFAAEHRAGGAMVSSFVERVLAHESRRVAAGSSLRLGSTILLVASRR